MALWFIIKQFFVSKRSDLGLNARVIGCILFQIMEDTTNTGQNSYHNNSVICSNEFTNRNFNLIFTIPCLTLSKSHVFDKQNSPLKVTIARNNYRAPYPQTYTVPGRTTCRVYCNVASLLLDIHRPLGGRPYSSINMTGSFKLSLHCASKS